MLEDIPTKAKVEKGDAEATTDAQVRNIRGALSNPATATKVGNEWIAGLLAFMTIITAIVIVHLVPL